MHEDILDQTNRYIDLLSEKEIKILDIAERLDQARTTQAKIKLDVSSDVLNEVDDKGKAVYSNAEKRDAETQSRLNENIDYIESTNAVHDLTRKHKENQIEADSLRWKIRTNLAFASHTVNPKEFQKM